MDTSKLKKKFQFLVNSIKHLDMDLVKIERKNWTLIMKNKSKPGNEFEVKIQDGREALDGLRLQLSRTARQLGIDLTRRSNDEA